MDEQMTPQSTTESQAQISSIALAHLRSTLPWIRFVAIFGMIACGFLVLGGLGAMMKMPMGGIIFIFYLVLALVIFFPQLYLLQYANNIRRYIDTNNNVLLEKAFDRQKSYWMYLGVLLIIYCALIVLVLLVFAFAGATIFSILKHTNPYMQQ